MFPKVPQSSLGILRIPQLPPPLEHPSLRTLQNKCLSNHQSSANQRTCHINRQQMPYMNRKKCLLRVVMGLWYPVMPRLKQATRGSYQLTSGSEYSSDYDHPSQTWKLLVFKQLFGVGTWTTQILKFSRTTHSLPCWEKLTPFSTWKILPKNKHQKNPFQNMGDFLLLGGGFKYFYVHPYLGKIPILTNTNIFQMVWFNHQLAC